MLVDAVLCRDTAPALPQRGAASVSLWQAARQQSNASLAAELAKQSVDISNACPSVQVCHEETLGDYASFTNIQEGTPELGGQLWCDYKMVRSREGTATSEPDW